MTRLLQINTSLFADQGQSSQLAARFVAAWREANPSTEVVTRDLANTPVPQLDAARFMAFATPAAERDAVQNGYIADSDALIAELATADVVVLGLPLYNFGVPSQLKNWFDQLARAGVTFRYTPDGAVGLLADKKVYVFAARGGHYAGTPLDTQTPYMRDFFRFIGINQVEFVYAEGMNRGAAVKARALDAAHATIRELVAEPVALAS
jgi:FMN-dependent NADH-azoreductase